ncbi:MAG: hypothetical protein N2C14_10540, partial [Planctomycetales bacterium]
MLAVITDADQAPGILVWASVFAAAKKTTLSVLCWTAPAVDPSTEPDDDDQSSGTAALAEEVRAFLADSKSGSRLAVDAASVEVSEATRIDV